MKDWKAHHLDQLGTVARGKSRHRPRNDPALYGGEWPFFQTGDVKEAQLYLTNFTQTYSDTGLAQSKLWPIGTLCITIAANIAETAILGIPGCFPDSIVGFTADPAKADVRFIKYYIEMLKQEIQSASRGTTQDNLSVDKLLTFDFVVPEIGQQKEIASILSAYDDLIENNTRRIAILEEMARRIYDEWFVRFRFPGHEGVPMVESELGLVPEGWGFTALGDLVNDMRDTVNPDAVAPETPYVGLEHIPRRSIALADWGQAIDVTSTKLRFRARDILFGKIRPYFHKVAVAPVAGVASSDAIVMRVKSDKNFGMALAVVSSDAFVAHATQTSNGTKMPRANWGVLRQYPVPTPPDELQARFSDFMEKVVATVSNYVLRNRNLRTTRDLLLPKLISGELDVSTLPEPQAETT
ncbi:MAG: restriction endonuclease subunit S [Gammaproteobacteria bacterium]|uniref:restriction endonuclease subunit S n=1 Tax=Rhodoferax sp. TaxID=50421 RepID=UPI0017DC652D|nr:restriction endonuclease subunit S [Rhodoferax sp.]MBU3900664.1 restriction endonuclease subunit S [Gammaproteobacteria bacterium]MBA3058118.1 restriction endonuclease subunit S [Rhodoferax sp.]MBU3998410.1 restriction endonuclease subunit S [Gammaproteobacteria bacterium]MBU4081322.1 restriction endonuclease subunit S [Gammaproteobacteria bacterium]MBU4114510.1 restriction endonuclease subunit S [Gammaproteobacteria bacterium]